MPPFAAPRCGGGSLVQLAALSPAHFCFPKPAVGFGPTTYCLQNSCSTTELSRRIIILASESHFHFDFPQATFGLEIAGTELQNHLE